MHAYMKTTVAVTALIAGVSLVTATAQADEGWYNWKCDDGNVIQFKKDIIYNGTGCPTGSLDDSSIDVAEDGSEFTITFGGDYVAEQGYGIDRKLNTKNCVIRVPVSVPKGLQFSVSTVTLRGFASISPWAKGTHKSRVYFPSYSPRGDTVYNVINGGRNGKDTDYESVAEVDTSTYSKCGGDSYLGIDSRVYLGGKNRRDYSSMSLDSADGVIFPIAYKCHIRRCDDGGDNHYPK